MALASRVPALPPGARQPLERAVAPVRPPRERPLRGAFPVGELEAEAALAEVAAACGGFEGNAQSLRLLTRLEAKVPGAGLNLTRATHVVHYDRWWNPAVEDQATDRAYRIGQDNPVQVHRLIAEGTLEDRIAALLEKKRELAEAVVGAGEGWIADLSDEELGQLVSLRAAS